MKEIKTKGEVSIFIPNYNSERFIEATLRSILNQTHEDFQLYILDDQSTDRSVDLIRSFNDPRIHITINERRYGLTANFNNCLRRCETAYCCVMHCDDTYHPRYLEVMLAHLTDHPTAQLAHCDFNTMDEFGSVFDHFHYNLKRKFLKCNGEKILLREPYHELALLLRGDYIICPSIMYRTEVFQKVGYYNESYHQVEDWDFLLRVLLHHEPILYVHEKLFNYRLHASATSANKKKLLKYKEHLAMLEEKAREIQKRNLQIPYTLKDVHRNTLRILLWDLKENLKAGEIQEAMQKFTLAKERILCFQGTFLYFCIKVLIRLGRVSGHLLDLAAKTYLRFERKLAS